MDIAQKKTSYSHRQTPSYAVAETAILDGNWNSTSQNHKERNGLSNLALISEEVLLYLLMERMSIAIQLTFGGQMIGIIQLYSQLNNSLKKESTKLLFTVVKIVVMVDLMSDTEEETIHSSHWLKKMLKNQLLMPSQLQFHLNKDQEKQLLILNQDLLMAKFQEAEKILLKTLRTNLKMLNSHKDTAQRIMLNSQQTTKSYVMDLKEILVGNYKCCLRNHLKRNGSSNSVWTSDLELLFSLMEN